ncbi:DUF1273 domain-containing protein [Priestia megaterium]|nr:DUF1273 domain-containing protein [Priestia megaterium]
MKVLTITGYKPFELGIFNDKHPGIVYIKKALQQRLTSLVEDGLEWVLISGQLGVELWAAEVVFDLQLEHPQLQLGVLTPFLDQEEKWNEANRERYEFILSQADFVDSITKKKYESPNQFRLKNQFLVSKSDGICFVYDEEHEGSPKYMLDAAKKRAEQEEYPIVMITSHDLQNIAEEEKYSSF